MSSNKHMTAPKHVRFTPNPLSHLVTSLALVSCLGGAEAIAQEIAQASSTAVTASGAAAGADIQVIDVMGTRQAEESAINRKKKAKTAMDSIVAEDVGALPDKNIGEAISRIAGIGLDRGEMGEGVGISVRGNSADLTRIEIDGMGMMSGGGANSANAGTLADGGTGRGQGVRDLPSELIKSVDVIKGSTADMSEGSLGGGVQIKTRSSLEFNKRYTSVRVSDSLSSLNEDHSPTVNLVFVDKFFDDRFGVLFNFSKGDLTNEGHSIQNSDNSRGYNHFLDIDNSAEKTFSFNPDTVIQNTAALTPLLKSPLTAGGTLDFESPYSLVQKSASAQSKSDCYSLFPSINSTQLGAINGATARTAALSQRNHELQTCLNQWNDWTPQNIRNIKRRDYEDRQNADVRFDFKVNDDLVLFTKLSKSSRDILNTFSTYSQGGSIAVGSTAGTFVDTAGVRNAVAGSGWYTNTYTDTWNNTGYATKNAITNLIPGSATVDAHHHVTSYKVSNSTIAIDQVESDQKTDIQYLQFGGTYEKDQLLAEFMASSSSTTFSRNDMRAGISYNSGETLVTVDKNGLWHSNPTTVLDQSNAANYITMSTNSTTKALNYSVGLNQQQSRLNEMSEDNAKADFTYRIEDEIPFITQVKSGLAYRENNNEGWGKGGAIIQNAVGTVGTAGYQAAITLPNMNARGSVVACENTTASTTTGGTPCAYGVVNSLPTSRDMTITVTQAQMQDWIQQSLKASNGTFFGGMSGRTNDYIDGWYEFDARKFYQLAGATNHLSLDCMKECTATDGNVYKQPKFQALEKNYAAYVMADFEYNKLPLDMALTGNIGARYVQTDSTATGAVTYNRLVKTASWDPATPNSNLLTYSYVRLVSVDATSKDVLPSLNLALWTIPDELVVRYNWGETVARPNINQMLPAGTCVYSEVTAGNNDMLGENEDATDMGCSTFGNAALKPWKNTNQNLSIEWYPNKGQMLSASIFKQEADRGGAKVTPVTNSKVFANSNFVDPISGEKVSDIEWAYNTYVNGPGSSTEGFEISAKSSFSFLPSYFKYTGVDFNYSVTKNTSTDIDYRDLNSGDKLPLIGQVPNSYNLAFWYDDGHLSARIALQHRGKILRGLYNTTLPSVLSGFGGNTTTIRIYPNAFVDTATALEYNPGAPVFEDATNFVDAKVAYRFDSNFEIYLEGRNLTKQGTTFSTGGYYDFESGADSLYEYKYFGRRINFGVNYKF